MSVHVRTANAIADVETHSPEITAEENLAFNSSEFGTLGASRVSTHTNANALQ